MGVKLSCGQNQKISQDQVNFAAKNIKANFIACEFSGCYIWRGIVSYPMTRKFHSAEWQIGIRYKNTCLEIIFSNVIKLR